MKLPFMEAKDWRWRWMVTSHGDRLHRIASGTVEDDMYVGVRDGTTVCGLKGRFHMPGFPSRLGAERCWRCCKALGVAYGEGAPYNSGAPEPGQGPSDAAEEPA